MNSLRRQLTRSLLGVLTVLLAAALVTIGLIVRHELVSGFDAALQTKALAVSSLVETENGRVQFDFSDDFLREFGGEKPHNYFQIWDAAGIVLARSPSLGTGELPRRFDSSPHRVKAWDLELPRGRPGRAMGFDFEVKPSDPAHALPIPPHVQLVVAVDREELGETLGSLLAAVAGCGAMLFAAVWFVVPRVLRRGLAPLDRLGAEVARIDAATLAAPLTVADLPAELRPIGDRLNALLHRLAVSFERERRFSADLAHELRTPLAELRSSAECALKWPETRDPGADREVLAIALQMETLVSRMLLLARGERGQLAVAPAPLELADFVAHTWRPFATRAAERTLRTSFDLAPGAVRADGVMLRGILQNLFDNTIAHAPAGAELRVTGAATAGGGYCLRCANPAGDLTPADVTRLFDRFWRKEAARSGGEHVGLGLGLAQTFAVAMGWRLTAALDAQGWLEFTLETGGQ